MFGWMYWGQIYYEKDLELAGVVVEKYLDSNHKHQPTVVLKKFDSGNIQYETYRINNRKCFERIDSGSILLKKKGNLISTVIKHGDTVNIKFYPQF
jgi:hypothetical protein